MALWDNLGLYPISREMLYGAEPFLLPSELDWSFPFEPRIEFQGRPGRRRPLETITQDVVSDKDKFQVMLKLSQFKQDEIKVKVTGNHLVVEAEHEEKPEEAGHQIYRRISRRFHLPKNSDLDNISSTLSEDGVLTVCAPKKPLETKNERTIEIKSVPSIQQGGQPETQGKQSQGTQKMEVEESGTAGSTQIPVTHKSSKK